MLTKVTFISDKRFLLKHVATVVSTVAALFTGDRLSIGGTSVFDYI
jgi:hypothetical protein